MVRIFEGGKADGNKGDGREPRKRRSAKTPSLRLTEEQRELAEDLKHLKYIHYLDMDGTNRSLKNFGEEQFVFDDHSRQMLAALEPLKPAEEPGIILMLADSVSPEDRERKEQEFRVMGERLKRHEVDFRAPEHFNFGDEHANKFTRGAWVNARQLAEFLGSAPVVTLMEKCRTHEGKVRERNPEATLINVALNSHHRAALVDLRHQAERRAYPQRAGEHSAEQRAREVDEQGRGGGGGSPSL